MKFCHDWKKQNHKEVKQRLSETRNREIRESGPALIISMGESVLSLDTKILELARNQRALFGINAFPLTKMGSRFPPNYLILNDEPFWFPRNEAESRVKDELLLWLAKNPNCTVAQPAQKSRFSKFNSTIFYHGNPLTSFTRNIDITKPLGTPNSTIFFATSIALYLGFSPVIVVGHDFTFAKNVKFLQTEFQIKRVNPLNSTTAYYPLRTFRENMSNLYASTALHIHFWKLFISRDVLILSDLTVIDSIPKTDAKEVSRFFSKIRR
jgi:hypothetical protein